MSLQGLVGPVGEARRVRKDCKKDGLDRHAILGSRGSDAIVTIGVATHEG